MRVALIAAALVLTATLGSAQSPVLNPDTVSFTASADHNATFIDGTPVLSKYLLRFFAEGATVAIQEQDLGKPTPVNGVIEITNRALFTGTPLSLDTKYVARVAAMGPGGERTGDPSSPFANASPMRAPAAPGAAVITKK